MDWSFSADLGQIRTFVMASELTASGTITPFSICNSANLQSVEVLKGPAAILYGAVEPGGIVNVVTKQPGEEPKYSVQQQFASYAAYRTTASATGPLTQDKSLLYRLDASYENNGSFVDLGYARNLFFSGCAPMECRSENKDKT